MKKTIIDLATGEAKLVDLTPEEIAEREEGLAAQAALVDISDRQFFQMLASEPYRIISQDEALDAVRTGIIPQVMQDVIDSLPEAERFSAIMLLSGATQFKRANPMVGIFAASRGMDGTAVDAFWRAAAAL